MRRKVFERYVREAVEGIPRELRDALDNIDIVIEDYPEDELLDEMGVDGLLGLYEGIPLPEREIGEVNLPDKITLFRGEILDTGLRGKALVDEIRITVIHEIGHYFGLGDDQMEDMGY